MGILLDLVGAVMHLCCVAADMVILLLLCRIVARCWNIAWVERINDRVKDIVDPVISAISRFWCRVAKVQIPPRCLLAASLLTLCLARIVMLAVARLILI
jgi:hypothetical protein